MGIQAAAINGKVVGDLCVDTVYLGSQANVYGNLTCRSLKMDRAAVLVGQLTVSRNLDVGIEAYKRMETVKEDNYTAEAKHEEKVQPNSTPAPPKGQIILTILLPQSDLYVKRKAEQSKLCNFLTDNSAILDAVFVTLDSHHVIYIERQSFLCSGSQSPILVFFFYDRKWTWDTRYSGRMKAGRSVLK